VEFVVAACEKGITTTNFGGSCLGALNVFLQVSGLLDNSPWPISIATIFCYAAYVDVSWMVISITE